ncbi:hypothetical protein GALMADRAFT_243570 [Galerina marginata CBS 339.88]|uniref:Protein kinase domain-containing protein n=1 Tax=Galerina marginata (strain CBS 339.88) TaxID=685588 RepID=A0A067THW8_GALM3|nr:hypothetical protein GALMADRAFT_243570 [Galerina marginata CBS 339.88]
MSLSWHQRKTRLSSLLKGLGDEDAEGIALDRLMHGQSVIGKTAKTTEIDDLRFKDRDLDVVGTLEYGQFGVIDVVACRLNNRVYVRKSIEKKFALRTREQCSPQFERDLLLQALKTDSPWAPHLLCAFQTQTHLNLVMDYAEGGTLWDVLESSPHDGRVPESDLRWWAPQIVSAIHWCHSQGFAHRDIKPHNFVLTPDAHVLLIDFGSAAPLLPPKPDGSQIISKRYCLVPCGTCDYISPEILQAHEEALVALELEDEDDVVTFGKQPESEGYGAETDWWSLGAMLYEMAYGVAPFFANDIRQTYSRIMNHEKSLRFDHKVEIAPEYQHFLHRLLTHAKQRLGRRNVMEITDHPLFEGIDWTTLSTQPAPPNLHLPQFTYSEPKAASAQRETMPPEQAIDNSGSFSQGFAFSAFFQPSSTVSPGLSILRPSPLSTSWKDSSSAASSFIGFSWGPQIDAFPDNVASTQPAQPNTNTNPGVQATPRPLIRTPLHGPRQTPGPANYTHHTLSVPLTWGPGAFTTPGPLHAYSTPIKPYALSPYATLPRTSTVRRTAPRRNVSDREAMKQLVDCVGMSARKKVLESGRKPRVIAVAGIKGQYGSAGTGTGMRYSGSTGMGLKTGSGGTLLRKELRFDRFATPIPGPDYSRASSDRSRVLLEANADPNPNIINLNDNSDIYYPQEAYNQNPDRDAYASSESTESEGGHPPSPSPSPRPGSAMSMMSMSRRSGTPTISGYFSGTGLGMGMLSGRMRSGSGSVLVPMGVGDRDRDRSVTATMTMTTSSGLLSIPSAGAGNLEFKIGQPPGLKAQMLVAADIKTPFDERNQRPSSQQRPQASAQPAVSASLLSRPLPAPEANVEVRAVRRHSVGSRRDLNPTHGSRQGLASLPPDTWLVELEARHAAMMQDIEDLEERFNKVSMVVRG